MFHYATWFDKLPDDSLDIYRPHVSKFFETMYERHMIWKRRFIDNKPKPWTDDPIFRTSKFTNVYRELDRNSQWQIKNIMLDDGLSLKDLIWKVMVFRYFNNPETFIFNPKGKKLNPKKFGVEEEDGLRKVDTSEAIPASKWRNGIPSWDEYDEEEFSLFISGVRSSGQNPFTNAYLINSMAAPGKSRDYCYTRVVIPYLHKHLDELIEKVQGAENPLEIIDYLETFPGVANFISHEFYQDFTYISKYTDKEFMKFDQNDFTNVGPGCSVGIRLTLPNLYGRKEQYGGIYVLQGMAPLELARIGNKRGEPFPYVYWNKEKREYEIKEECNISLHQIEMWLCEFQKYWKMTIGEGKQRSNFVPKTKKL